MASITDALPTSSIADQEVKEEETALAEEEDLEVFEDEPAPIDVEKGARKSQYKPLGTSEEDVDNPAVVESHLPSKTSAEDVTRAVRVLRRRRSPYEAVAGEEEKEDLDASVTSVSSTISNKVVPKKEKTAPMEILAKDEDEPSLAEMGYPTYQDCSREVSKCGCMALIAFAIGIYVDVIHAIFTWPVPVPNNYFYPVSFNHTTLMLPFYTHAALEEDPDSPQAIAFQWLSTLPAENFDGLGSSQLQEIFAMATLVNALDNNTLRNATSLFNVCDTETTLANGITILCNENNSVSSLIVKDLNLTAATEFPPEIELFSELEEFSLQQSLLPSNSLLSIPTQIMRLSKLDTFKIEDCAIRGTLPAFLGDMTTLTSLVLSGNQFTGSLPLEWMHLDQLQELDVSKNLLTGEIPIELGGMTNLKNLYLEQNLWNITETPMELCALLDESLDSLGHSDCEGLLCGKNCPGHKNG